MKYLHNPTLSTSGSATLLDSATHDAKLGCIIQICGIQVCGIEGVCPTDACAIDTGPIPAPDPDPCAGRGCGAYN